MNITLREIREMITTNRIEFENKIAKDSKNIGTALGIGCGTGYVIRNRQDIFVKGTQNSVKKLGNKKTGYAIASAISAGIIGLSALSGRLLGSLSAKFINRYKSF